MLGVYVKLVRGFHRVGVLLDGDARSLVLVTENGVALSYSLVRVSKVGDGEEPETYPALLEESSVVSAIVEGMRKKGLMKGDTVCLN